MTTNASGRLNIGGVEAIKEITALPLGERTPHQDRRLVACLTALAHQPVRWYSYQPTVLPSISSQVGICIFSSTNERLALRLLAKSE